MEEETIKISDLERRLECVICYDLLTKPKILPCQHSFCLQCVDSLLVFNDDGGATLLCPYKCKGQIQLGNDETADLLKTPLLTAELLEMIESKKNMKFCGGDESCKSEVTCWCLVCKRLYCKDCYSNHKCHKKISLPGIIDKNKKVFLPSCQQHNALTKYVCKTCDNKFMCVYCKHRDHKLHETVKLNDLAEDIKNKYLCKLKKAKMQCHEHNISYSEAVRQAEEFEKQLIHELNYRMLRTLKNCMVTVNEQKKQLMQAYRDEINNYKMYLQKIPLMTQNIPVELQSLVNEIESKGEFRLVTEESELKDQENIVKNIRCLSVELCDRSDLKLGYFNIKKPLLGLIDEKLTQQGLFQGRFGKEQSKSKACRDFYFVKTFLDDTSEDEKFFGDFNYVELQEDEIKEFIDKENITGILGIVLMIPNLSFDHLRKYIEHAILKNKPNLLGLLLHMKLEIGAMDKTNLLHLAVSKDFKECVSILLNNKNFNAEQRGCKFLSTPLHYAVLNGHFEIASKLLENGTAVNLAINDGNTALHVAAKKNDYEIVKLLLQQSADVNVRNKAGNTALHLAVLERYTDVIQLLLDYESDVNLQNNDGNTPLHCTALKPDLNQNSSGNETDIARLLLDYKADSRIKNKKGQTVYDIGFMSYCRILKQYDSHAKRY